MMTLKEKLERLQELTIDELIARVKDKSVTSGELSVIRQMLNDNSINAITSPLEQLSQSVSVLPEFNKYN